MNTSIPNDDIKDVLRDEIRRMRERIEPHVFEQLKSLHAMFYNRDTLYYKTLELSRCGYKDLLKALYDQKVDVMERITSDIKEQPIVYEILEARKNPMFVKEGILEGARMDTLLRACSPAERRSISNIYVPPECRSGNMGDIAKIPEIIYHVTACNRYAELINDLENGSQCSSIPSDFRNHMRNENGQYSLLNYAEYMNLQISFEKILIGFDFIFEERPRTYNKNHKMYMSEKRQYTEDALGEALKNPLFIKQGVIVGAHISALLHECDKCELQSIVRCHVVRPPEIGEFDKPDAPKIKYIIDDALTHNDYFDLLEDLTDLHPTNKNQSQGRHI